MGVSLSDEVGFHQEIPDTYPADLRRYTGSVTYHRIPKYRTFEQALEMFNEHLGSQPAHGLDPSTTIRSDPHGEL